MQSFGLSATLEKIVKKYGRTEKNCQISERSTFCLKSPKFDYLIVTKLFSCENFHLVSLLQKYLKVIKPLFSMQKTQVKKVYFELFFSRKIKGSFQIILKGAC